MQKKWIKYSIKIVKEGNWGRKTKKIVEEEESENERERGKLDIVLLFTTSFNY